MVPHIVVPSVGCTINATYFCAILRCTIGAIHCRANCTMHCWCHTLLCHMPPSAVKCLLSQSAPFRCLPFRSTQFLTSSTHPNPKHDTLPHNVLLFTKWREISLRWVIQRPYQSGGWSCKLLLQQNYQQLISRTVHICSVRLSAAHIIFHSP